MSQVQIKRLPIIYDIPKDVNVINAFHERYGRFNDPYNEFADVCLSNIPFAASKLLMWKGKPLDLAPFQMVILNTLWHKTFPILLASRGAGKCIVGDSLVQTSEGFVKIKSICSEKFGDTPAKISMFGENGFNETIFTWKNAPEPIYKITSSNGYTLSGVGKHQIRIIENEEIVWKKMQDLIGSESVIISSNDSYAFSGKSTISNEEAYSLGQAGNDYIEIPDVILQSNKMAVANFIDGYTSRYALCGKTIIYQSGSKEFLQQLQIVLLSYGIVSALSNTKANYHLRLDKDNAAIYASQIRLFSKSLESGYVYRGESLYIDEIISVDILPDEVTYDVHIPNDHTFISNGFISHNTFMLAVYAAMRAMLSPGSKIVIVAAGFRQAKFVFEYIEKLYEYSPIFRACCPNGVRKPADQVYINVGDSVIRALPLGNGEKIRGMRATHVITDEFASISQEIFQVVVRGFASVSSNPIEAAREMHRQREAIKSGKMRKEDLVRQDGNQIVYSGTANFQFNHFYKLLRTHETIITNKIVGSSKEVNEKMQLHEDDAIQDGLLDYRDYAIVRLPYQGLPESYMDEKQIAEARMTMPSALFQMEYECIFPTDSDGFFRRSLINASTPGTRDYGGNPFRVEIIGDMSSEYVMGIDPARKTDNFAISILRLDKKTETYQNVYCYSMRGKSWPKAVRKIRELLEKFNIVRIAMDAGGGGNAVEDLLQDDNTIMPGEQAIWRHDEEEHRRYAGRHILEMVNFAPKWIAEANYGMAADIEHKRLLFPYRTLDIARRDYSDADELEEEVWDEIAEQINEMCMIVVTPTKTGVQHFDTPELPASQQGTLKTYQRKDRYSAILLATYAARTYLSQGQRKIVPSIGGWIDSI